MTSDQLRAIGLSSRRLLALAWSQNRYDAQLVRHGLQCVARTFESDLQASAALLRKALEPTHLAQHGYQEAFRLASELKRLFVHDPDFVRDVYAALFAFEEQSTEANPLGSSQILAMVSNRRQDYQGAQYVLAHDFPRFLAAAPEQATLALVASIRGYISNRHANRFEKYLGGTFALLGERAHVEPDGSCMWDEGGVYQSDHPVEMLQAFEAYLAAAVRELRLPEVRRALVVLAAANRSAVVWRRLLVVGARAPERLGLLIRELAWAEPLLRALDTTTQAGEFIHVMFPLLSPAERVRVERTILALAKEEPGGEQEWSDHQRDRLLGCLPRTLVATAEALHRIAQLQSAGDMPRNEPPFQMSVGWGESSTEAQLERRGVDVRADRNQKLLALRQSVSDLEITQELVTQGGEALNNVLVELTSLLGHLRSALGSGVDTAVEEDAWGSLAEVAVRIARLELSCQSETGRLTREILFEAADRPDPVHDPMYDAAFDEHPAWGSPASRIEAAEGLMLLARHADCMSPDLLGVIDRLGRDPVPAVRLQIASRLWLMNKTAPDRMWEMVERMSADDPSSGVLRWLVNDSLGRLAQLDTSRVIQLVQGVFRRVDSGPGVAELHDHCLDILSSWYVWRDTPDARDELFRLAAIRPVLADEARHICADLRRAFVAEKGPVDPTGDGVRARALDLLGKFLAPAMAELGHLLKRTDALSDAERDRARELISFADLVGSELYFATGIFQERSQPELEERVTRAQRERLLREALPLIESLADVGLPSLTHHLLEIVEENISADPRGSFVMIGKMLIAGNRGGYEYESLAEEFFVRLVARYLAEHRVLFQEDAECRTLLPEILDIFVKAGWPSAQRLSYRLDEIFR